VAGRWTMAVIERRSDVRAPVSLMGAVMTPDGESPVLLLDLSARGARLRVDCLPDPAGEYQLHFTVHGMSWSPKFRVVHWTGGEGAYHWGCTFFEIPADQSENLRRTVHAAIGLAEMSVRPWEAVSLDALTTPADEVLVGSTASGHDIRIAGQDCLDMGPDGVELFVRTVAGLETA
jgi:hypothetical protein